MITTKQIAPQRHDVFLVSSNKCIGDFTKDRGGPFHFYPIMFDYHMTWSAELLLAIGHKLDELNKK